MFDRIRRGVLPLAILVAAWVSIPPAVAHPANNPLGLHAHHITASVLDIDRAVSWYTDMLGIRVTHRGSRDNGAFKFAELSIPGFGVALVQVSGAVAPTAPADKSAPAWIHIVFSVPDPDRAFKLLQGRGAKVMVREKKTGVPVTSFLIQDSEGNEIEIVSAK